MDLGKNLRIDCLCILGFDEDDFAYPPFPLIGITEIVRITSNVQAGRQSVPSILSFVHRMKGHIQVPSSERFGCLVVSQISTTSSRLTMIRAPYCR